MLKNLLLAGVAAAIVAGVGYANQSVAKTVIIPVSKAPLNNGKQMYVNYCAPCHGVEGMGNGPAAAALKRQPTNLAALSRNNGGKFPSTHIASVLEFGAANPSHGTAEMPEWGPMLGSVDTATNDANVRALRISNLSRYLQSLQQK
ncbi:MAG: c-type cytochrome [Terracidiphilus sp.]|jgi:mono/diheme cytochrome c family protein